MAELLEARSAAFGPSVSDIFNQTLKVDQNAILKAADIIKGDPSFNRPADYFINVFSISPIDQIRHRPVDFPRILLRACPKSKPWVIATRVANIIKFKWISADTQQPSFHSITGERWATDLLNPALLGEDMWAETVGGEFEQMHGGSDDLTRRGFFWERRQKAQGFCETCQDVESVCPVHDVPSEQAIKRTKIRLERHYRQCVQKAEDLARTGKMSEIGDHSEAHVAADYLGISTSWHMATEIPVKCPNCGESIKEGAAYHVSSMGAVCVVSWQRTVAAGVKTRADVPEEARWWTEEEPEKRGPGRPRKVDAQPNE